MHFNNASRALQQQEQTKFQFSISQILIENHLKPSQQWKNNVTKLRVDATREEKFNFNLIFLDCCSRERVAHKFDTDFPSNFRLTLVEEEE